MKRPIRLTKEMLDEILEHVRTGASRLSGGCRWNIPMWSPAGRWQDFTLELCVHVAGGVETWVWRLPEYRIVKEVE